MAVTAQVPAEPGACPGSHHPPGGCTRCDKTLENANTLQRQKQASGCLGLAPDGGSGPQEDSPGDDANAPHFDCGGGVLRVVTYQSALNCML